MQLTMKKRVIAQVKLQLAQPMSFHRVLHALKQNQGKPRCLLVGTPIHGNLGDHLLTLSVAKFWSADRSVDGMFHAAWGEDRPTA